MRGTPQSGVDWCHHLPLTRLHSFYISFTSFTVTSVSADMRLKSLWCCHLTIRKKRAPLARALKVKFGFDSWGSHMGRISISTIEWYKTVYKPHLVEWLITVIGATHWGSIILKCSSIMCLIYAVKLRWRRALFRSVFLGLFLWAQTHCRNGPWKKNMVQSWIRKFYRRVLLKDGHAKRSEISPEASLASHKFSD